MKKLMAIGFSVVIAAIFSTTSTSCLDGDAPTQFCDCQSTEFTIGSITITDTIVTPADTTIVPEMQTITPADTMINGTDTTITPADTMIIPADTTIVPGFITVLADTVFADTADAIDVIVQVADGEACSSGSRSAIVGDIQTVITCN